MSDYSTFSTWQPSIYKEDCTGIHSIELLSKHLSKRRLFLVGEVNDEMANNFVSCILHLSETSEPIDIILSGPGGSVSAGLVIYDILQELKGKVPVSVYVTSTAASMNAIILAGAEHRYCLPSSRIMIHQPLINSLGGSASSVKQVSDSLLQTKDRINKILSEHTGKTLEEIDNATSYDHWFTAEEAIEFGLVDEIKFPF